MEVADGVCTFPAKLVTSVNDYTLLPKYFNMRIVTIMTIDTIR